MAFPFQILGNASRVFYTRVQLGLKSRWSSEARTHGRALSVLLDIV